MKLRIIFLLTFSYLGFPIFSQSNQQISGYVTADGRGLKNARVIFTTKGVETSTRDDNFGKFIVTGDFKDGELVKIIIVPDKIDVNKYETTKKEIRIMEGGLLGEIPMNKKFEKGFLLLVKDEVEGGFIPNAKVSINQEVLTTDEFGTVLVEVNEQFDDGMKAINILVKKEGYKSKLIRRFFAQGQTLEEIFLEKVIKEDSKTPVIDYENMRMLDSRNGQSYKIREINGQIWMDENLELEQPESVYYKNTEENSNYGRLYNWREAQRSCPKGWRLPTKSEFEDLIEHFGGKRATNDALQKTAYIKGGKRDIKGKFIYKDKFAYFWSNTTKSEEKAFYFGLGTMKRAYVYHADKGEAMYCRCIQVK